MKYQFQIDGRGFGAPLREKWTDAAQDAVNAGYAYWRDGGVALESGQGAAIAAVQFEKVIGASIAEVEHVVLLHRCPYCGDAMPNGLAVGPVACLSCGNIPGIVEVRAMPNLGPKIVTFLSGAAALGLTIAAVKFFGG